MLSTCHLLNKTTPNVRADKSTTKLNNLQNNHLVVFFEAQKVKLMSRNNIATTISTETYFRKVSAETPCISPKFCNMR